MDAPGEAIGPSIFEATILTETSHIIRFLELSVQMHNDEMELRVTEGSGWWGSGVWPSEPSGAGMHQPISMRRCAENGKWEMQHGSWSQQGRQTDEKRIRDFCGDPPRLLDYFTSQYHPPMSLSARLGGRI